MLYFPIFCEISSSNDEAWNLKAKQIKFSKLFEFIFHQVGSNQLNFMILKSIFNKMKWDKTNIGAQRQAQSKEESRKKNERKNQSKTWKTKCQDLKTSNYSFNRKLRLHEWIFPLNHSMMIITQLGEERSKEYGITNQTKPKKK